MSFVFGAGHGSLDLMERVHLTGNILRGGIYIRGKNTTSIERVPLTGNILRGGIYIRGIMRRDYGLCDGKKTIYIERVPLTGNTQPR